MLIAFLQDPANYSRHFHLWVAALHMVLVLKLSFVRFTISFILPITYAYEPKVEDDRIVHVMRSFMGLSGMALGARANMLMETFPFRMLDMKIGRYSS